MTDAIKPISREEFERRAADLGIRATFNDTRCHGEWKNYEATGQYYMDTPYWHLLVARGAAVEREGIAPTLRTAPPAATGYVHREMTALTGLPAGSGGGCHYCGLDPRTCDCR